LTERGEPRETATREYRETRFSTILLYVFGFLLALAALAFVAALLLRRL